LSIDRQDFTNSIFADIGSSVRVQLTPWLHFRSCHPMAWGPCHQVAWECSSHHDV